MMPSSAREWQELEKRLRTHVVALASATRVPGSAEHAQARDYVVRHLQQANFAVVEDHFTEGTHSATNIRATRPTDDATLPLLVVGAHYDSIPTSPGADDNASAVAALLEIARAFESVGTAKAARLELVAYDLEEYGLGGSHRHAQQIYSSRTPFRGMISLEMLGYVDHRPGSQNLPTPLKNLYPDVGDFIGVCANEASRELLAAVTQSLKSAPELPVQSIAVPGRGEMLPDIRRSDHSSFWDLGMPALMITDTSFFRNPHYHRETDRPETLDYSFLARVCVGAGRAVAALLGIP